LSTCRFVLTQLIEHTAKKAISPPTWGNTHNITRSLEAEFNEVDILPKTREAAIMATAAYIAANASNDDEHMR
jgi:hypothetical protein